MLGIEGTLSELGKTKNFTKVHCENGHQHMKLTDESSLPATLFFS